MSSCWLPCLPESGIAVTAAVQQRQRRYQEVWKGWQGEGTYTWARKEARRYFILPVPLRTNHGQLGGRGGRGKGGEGHSLDHACTAPSFQKTVRQVWWAWALAGAGLCAMLACAWWMPTHPTPMLAWCLQAELEAARNEARQAAAAAAGGVAQQAQQVRAQARVREWAGRVGCAHAWVWVWAPVVMPPSLALKHPLPFGGASALRLSPHPPHPSTAIGGCKRENHKA